MRERLENLDTNVRSWIEEEGSGVRERLEKIDLPTRLGIWRDQLLGKGSEKYDAEEQNSEASEESDKPKDLESKDTEGQDAERQDADR